MRTSCVALFFFLQLPLLASALNTDPGARADAYADAKRYESCPDLRGARFHLERARLLCVGCSHSPYATDESIATEIKDAEQRLAQAEAECRVIERQKASALRRAKMPEPKIGMTRDQVIRGTNWGDPDRVNSTESANLVTEQWVYPGGRYLYFRNGRVHSIQRSSAR